MKDLEIKKLDALKEQLVKKVNILREKKVKLYSNIDISMPMCSDEKKLNKDISDLFSEINKIIKQKRKLQSIKNL